MIHPPKASQTTAIEVFLSPAGRAAAEKSPQPYLDRARHGALVVLPDVRFSGDYSAEQLARRLRRIPRSFRQAYAARRRSEIPTALAAAWDRNSILWGRPIPGMMVADLQCVLDLLELAVKRSAAEGGPVQVTARDSAALALAAVLAACLDPRIAAVDAGLPRAMLRKECSVVERPQWPADG